MSAWLGTGIEKRSFDFFLTRAGSRLSGFFTTPFWSREVLQAALHYPSIRHVVGALGAAYECFESNRTVGDMHFALQQCDQSIRHINGLVDSSSQSPEAMYSIITASILFAIFASIQGQLPQAIEHVRSVIRVLHQLERLSLQMTFLFPSRGCVCS